MTPPAPGSRNVLLTGASSGIGRGSALRSARAGDRVVALARHAPALRALAAEHPGIEIGTCHLRDGAQRPGLVERVLVAAHPSGAAGHGPRPARAAPAGRLRERRRPAAAVPLLGVAVPAVSPTSCPDTGGSWPCRWPAPRRCA